VISVLRKKLKEKLISEKLIILLRKEEQESIKVKIKEQENNAKRKTHIKKLIG